MRVSYLVVIHVIMMAAGALLYGAPSEPNRPDRGIGNPALSTNVEMALSGEIAAIHAEPWPAQGGRVASLTNEVINPDFAIGVIE